MRHLPQLKNRLIPYLFAAADDAHARGWPVMRAMLLEFPDDPTCRLPGSPVHARRVAAGCADLPRRRRCGILSSRAGTGRILSAAKPSRVAESRNEKFDF